MVDLIYCDVCGTLNLEENNYCTHCGNKLIMEHVCPHCGEINPDNANFCIKCDNQINPIAIDDFDILFNEYNENLLLNAEISDSEYFEMLSNIFKRADYLDFSGNNVRDRILKLAGAFTQCKSKSRGHERGFTFLDNCIYYDDRLEDSTQIATIIHELAHYLLIDIVENLLCRIFNVRTSLTLETFVWYFLTLPEFKVMNEYCAHTVEGRFIPFGYQNYGSFNEVVNQLALDDDTLKKMVVFGNTFANEIIVYLEKYIDDDLREEIKLQYRKDLNYPSNDSIKIETKECLPTGVKNSYLLKVLYDVFKMASNEDVREELEFIKEGMMVN